MNRTFVLQAALQAVLLGACASLLPFDATASGRMATALVPVDSTDPVARAAVEAPASTYPWVYLGPQRATVSRLALSPQDPGKLVALLSDTGEDPLPSVLYTSHSAGERWVFNSQFGGGIHDAAFDAQQRDLLAGSFGLWFHEADGEWWDLALHPEHEYSLVAERVAVATAAGSPVWVTGRVGDENLVFRISSDLEAWTDVTPGLPGRVLPVELAVSDAQPGHVAVATIEQPANALRVFVTADNGASWTASTPAASFATVSTVRWVGEHLFVGGLSATNWRAELWRSTDHGATWQLSLATDAYWPHIDVAGVPGQPGLLWVGTAEGVYRSDDGGQSYQPPMPGTVQEVRRLVYEPTNAEIWAGLANEGVWVSGDQGESWEPRNAGLGAYPAVDVAVNPLDAGEVASMSDGIHSGLAQVATSTNGGLDWTRNASPETLQGHTVRFGPSGRLYATQVGHNNSTLLRRNANGQWQSIGFAWPGNAWLSMGDMNFGATEDTLLAAARVFDYGLGYYAYRLWRSGNGGQTWEAVLQGGANSQFARIERTMGPNGLRLFVLEQSYLTDVSGHLWASDDDGQTWFDATALLPEGMQQQYCTGDNGEVVFAHSEIASYQNQMFRSTDAGDTWTQTDWAPGTYFLGTPFTAMHCPGNAQQVYLGGSMGRVMRSDDGGNSVHVVLATDATWGETWIEKIELSPAGLYVAHSGGVWVNPNITLPENGPTGLVVERTHARMRYRVTLQWHGGAARVDIRRNGAVLATVDNAGQWSNTVVATGTSSTWQVCDAGTGDCSAMVADN